jgi:hypothetical protein
VWEQYDKSLQPERIRIGRWGWRLRRARNRADYDDGVVNLPKDTRVALLGSGEVFSLLANL